jgi:hypothetical protein
MIRAISLNPSQKDISGYNSGDTVLIKCDATDEAFSIYLPDATVANAMFLIMKTDSSTNAVTVYPYSNQTINDESSVSISSRYDCRGFIPDGSNYYMTTSYLAIWG